MKVVLVSDLHIHTWQEHSVITKDGPSRLLDCVEVLTDVRHYMEEHGITDCIIGGDIWHKRGVIFTLAYNETVRELALFKKRGLRVVAVDGNHDHATKAGNVHAIEALEAAGLVETIPIGDGWMNWALGNEELIVCGFSYNDNAEEFQRRWEQSMRDAEKHWNEYPRIAVFHHGFRGAAVGTTLEYVVKEPIALDNEKARAYDHLFSGHYHGRQPICDFENATYIGSPLEHMRGETKQDKGFLVYDTETNDYEVVPLKRPRFEKLTQEMIDRKDWSIVEGNFVDVVYEELPRDPDEFRDKLVDQGAVGVKLAPIIKRTKRSQNRVNIDLSTDKQTLLERYIDFMGISGKEKKRFLERGLEILNAVSD